MTRFHMLVMNKEQAFQPSLFASKPWTSSWDVHEIHVANSNNPPIEICVEVLTGTMMQ